MSRPDIYDEVYTYAKEYIAENSEYTPKVGKSAPTESKYFPLVIIPECKMVLGDETLHKGERKYKLTFEVEIYSTDKTVGASTIARQSIVEEIEKLVYEVFEEHYGMKGNEPEIRPNADTNVMRLYIKFTGIIDYRKIIFRR